MRVRRHQNGLCAESGTEQRSAPGIWADYADLRPVVGSEQGGIRPVVILQNNVGNRYSPTVIAAPITSRRKTNLPTHVSINRQVDKLRCNSVILMEQIRTIDKSRLMDRIGVLNDYEMQQVNQALGISVGLV